MNTQTLYISDGLVSFSNIDNLFNQIFLIKASCGYGKTSYVNDETDRGLLAALNKRKEELGLEIPPFTFEDVVLAVPRVSIKRQQESKNVAVETYHSLTKEKLQKRRVIVCDEAHCPFGETYAESYCDFIDVLLQCGDNLVKIFMTATPDTLKEFHGINCVQISRDDIAPKYQSDKIFISLSGKFKNVLMTYAPALGPSVKALSFVPSAAKSEKYAREWNLENSTKAGFQVSEYCKQETKEGERLVDIMDWAARRLLLDEERLPQDVVNMICTSVFEMGINISDVNVRHMYILDYHPDSIIQKIGRVRHDLDLVVLALDIYSAKEAINNFYKMNQARQEYEALETEGERSVFLQSLYFKSQRGEMPKVVRKINEYKYAWNKIGWDAVNANAYYGTVAVNFALPQEQWDRREHFFTYYDFYGNKLEKPTPSNWNFYSDLLFPYSKTLPQYRNFTYDNKANLAARNENWAIKFKDEGKEWLGKKLFKDEQNKLVEEWGQRFANAEGKKAKIDTILTSLEKVNLYSIKRGTTTNKSTGKRARYVEITLK